MTNDSSEINRIISEEVRNFTSWCERNKQQHNSEKSQLLIFTRSHGSLHQSLPVSVSSTMKILGVHLNSNLTWHDQVSESCKKASKRLRILRILKPHVSPNELHQVYVTSVRSIFDYACTLLVGLDIGLSKKLQRVDNRAHRIMFGDHRLCACKDDTLKKRREDLSLASLRKFLSCDEHILDDCLPKPSINPNRLRNFYCRTEKRRRSFFPFTTELFNKL